MKNQAKAYRHVETGARPVFKIRLTRQARELKNIIKRAVLLTNGTEILKLSGKQNTTRQRRPGLLNIARTTLYAKIEQYNIPDPL